MILIISIKFQKMPENANIVQTSFRQSLNNTLRHLVIVEKIPILLYKKKREREKRTNFFACF